MEQAHCQGFFTEQVAGVHEARPDTIRSDNGADTMADSQKTGGDAAYTFPHDFVVSGDFRPHAERLTGTISPWTAEGVPATGADADAGTAAATAKKGAQERVWVITNMKADGRTIVEGKVFVQDSGAIVGMEFAGEINNVAFNHIQALCAMASEVAGGHEIEKMASRSMSSTGGAGRRAKGEDRRPELPPPYTKSEMTLKWTGSTLITYKGNPEHETACGRSADSHPIRDDLIVVNFFCSDGNQEERVIRGANATARSEAAIRAWMEADEPWPGNAG